MKLPFLEAELEVEEKYRDAAWQSYIELLTRIAAQLLPLDHGDEKTALDRVHSLFGLARETIKNHGNIFYNSSTLIFHCSKQRSWIQHQLSIVIT